MSLENFNLKKEAIEALTTEETESPNMPVAIAVQEAEDLYAWAQDDKVVLEKAGLDLTLLEDLPIYAGALRYVQSQWQKDANVNDEVQKEWKAKAPQAEDLHDVIVHEMLHAYYNYPDLLAKVQQIAEGGGNADMIQDLSDLAILGKENPAPLAATNFDITLLDQAATLSDELSALLAEANESKMSGNDGRVLRDKAFTLMKRCVDEVRRHGQFKFWRTPERKKGYVSQYFKRKNNAARYTNSEGTE